MAPRPATNFSGLQDEVEITLKEDTIVIRAASNPREGWTEAFGKMSRRGDDVLLDGDLANEFDEKEWEW